MRIWLSLKSKDKKWIKGFNRRNDKLPFALLFKKGIKVNHNRTLFFLVLR
jgi:hypothetical protein